MKSISLDRLLKELDYVNKKLEELEVKYVDKYEDSVEYFILTGKQLLLKQFLIEAGYYENEGN